MHKIADQQGKQKTDKNQSSILDMLKFFPHKCQSLLWEDLNMLYELYLSNCELSLTELSLFLYLQLDSTVWINLKSYLLPSKVFIN